MKIQPSMMTDQNPKYSKQRKMKLEEPDYSEHVLVEEAKHARHP